MRGGRLGRHRLDEQGDLAGIVTRSDLLHVLRLRADAAA